MVSGSVLQCESVAPPDRLTWPFLHQTRPHVVSAHHELALDNENEQKVRQSSVFDQTVCACSYNETLHPTLHIVEGLRNIGFDPQTLVLQCFTAVCVCLVFSEGPG